MTNDKMTDFFTMQSRYAQFQIARDITTKAYARAKQWRANYLARNKYYVAVEEDSRLFGPIHRWLIDTSEQGEQRSISVDYRTIWEGDVATGIELIQTLDSSYSADIEINGVTVNVEITNKKLPQPNSNNSNNDSVAPASDPLVTLLSSTTLKYRVIFTMTNAHDRDAVVDWLHDLARSQDKHEPTFMTAMKTYWRSQPARVKRPLDAVVLDGTIREDVVADMQQFIEDEERYRDMGIPWHRGYLFHGPPGTGKTSLAAAIASHFGFDIYYVPLSSISNDADFMELILRVDSARAFVIMEDIDIVHGARERDDKNTGVTLTGLLNGLDGISTPHGLITVMTSNVRSVLDPALIRPGRVDVDIEIGYITDDQLQRLCQRFIGRSVDLPPVTGAVTPADVVGVFKNSKDGNVDEQLRDLLLLRAAEENLSEDGVHSGNRWV